MACRTFQNIVLGIVSKATHWYAGSDRLGLGRDQCGDVAPLKRTVHLRIGITSISRNDVDVDARGGFDVVHLWLDHLAFVRLSGRDLDAKDDTALVVDRRMLLVSRL
jgi:hypothetical protein